LKGDREVVLAAVGNAHNGYAYALEYVSAELRGGAGGRRTRFPCAALCVSRVEGSSRPELEGVA